MLSRLTISLAQLKAAINLEKLKNEIRQPLYSVYSSKNQKKPPKKQNQNNQTMAIWSILFKNGNNLYEHWKQ